MTIKSATMNHQLSSSFIIKTGALHFPSKRKELTKNLIKFVWRQIEICYDVPLMTKKLTYTTQLPDKNDAIFVLLR